MKYLANPASTTTFRPAANLAVAQGLGGGGHVPVQMHVKLKDDAQHAQNISQSARIQQAFDREVALHPGQQHEWPDGDLRFVW